MILPPPLSTLFPYTTLFRSHRNQRRTIALRRGREIKKRCRRGEAERARRRGIHGRHSGQDRKSTRLNSSHPSISYAVFCLKKKNIIHSFYIFIVSPDRQLAE